MPNPDGSKCNTLSAIGTIL